MRYLLLILVLIAPNLVRADWSINSWEYGEYRTTTASADNIMAVACTASYNHFKLHMAFVPSGPFITVPAGFSAKLVIDNGVTFNLKTTPASNSNDIMFYDIRRADIPLLVALRVGKSVRVEASFGDRVYIKTITLRQSASTIDQVLQNCRPREIVPSVIRSTPQKPRTAVRKPTAPPVESRSDILLRRQRELVAEGQERTIWYLDLDAEQVKDESFDDLEYLLEDYGLQVYK